MHLLQHLCARGSERQVPELQRRARAPANPAAGCARKTPGVERARHARALRLICSADRLYEIHKQLLQVHPHLRIDKAALRVEYARCRGDVQRRAEPRAHAQSAQHRQP